MNNSKDDKFVLTFDDDVVDMTNPNTLPKNIHANQSTSSSTDISSKQNAYSSASSNSYDPYRGIYDDNAPKTYGAFNTPDAAKKTASNPIDTPDSYGPYNLSKAYDPYGTYNPQKDSVSNQYTYNNGKSKSLTVSFILVICSMILYTLYVIYFCTVDSVNIKTYTIICLALNVFIFTSYIYDSFKLKENYSYVYQFVIAILATIFYPIIAFAIRGKKKIIPIIWSVLCILLSLSMFEHMYPILTEKILYSQTDADTYSSKYDKPMKNFKSIPVNATTGKTVNKTINEYFRNYDWDIEQDVDNSYIISVSGDINMLDSTGSYVSSVTTITFRMTSTMKSFTVIDLTIDGANQNTYAQTLWNQMIQ